ncbi:glutathione S-transferase [Paraburkholderia youngii]
MTELPAIVTFIAEVSLHAAVSAHARQTIETAFAQIESKLTDGCSYSLPCGYTIVDPFLLVLYRWGIRIGLPMGDTYQAWTASARHVLERPAVQRALHSEGISLEF